jgi:hypothetical protein
VVDIDAAIGYVVAHGDPVERARLSFLRTRASAPPDALDQLEVGQHADGGWPASGEFAVTSVDATCFRLGELDDLGGLHLPPARRALRWLAEVQHEDGTWQEHASLAAEAPAWAMPGDPEATFYLTAVAGFWLSVAEVESRRLDRDPDRVDEFADVRRNAARFIVGQLCPDGTWPSFLAAGWHAAGLLHHEEYYYESARMQLVLGDRLGDMSPADAASMVATLRRIGVGDDWLLKTACTRLGETQRSDGGWDSDEGPVFDVNTTLIAIRACL